MPFYNGIFATTVNPAELNKRSFASSMMRLYPNGVAPIFALTSQTGKSKAVSSTHGYFTKTLEFATCFINFGAGYASGVTTFVIDNGSGAAAPSIQAGQILYLQRTREIFRVLTVTGGGTGITVATRPFGRIAAAALVDNDQLIVIGTAFEEGSARPSARGLTTTYVINYTQIFRNAWAVTDTARASLTEMGFSNIAESRQDGALLHSSDIEAAIVYSQPKMDVSVSNQPVHATQGIIDAVSQYAAANVYTEVTSTTYAELIDALEKPFAFAHDMGESTMRMCFAGSTAMKTFNQIARLNGTVQIMQGQTSFGMRYQEFMFYKGTVILMEHPIFNGLALQSGTAIVVDMPALKLAYMNGRDTKVEEYGGEGRNNANGVDAVGGSFTTEFATELLNPGGCSVMFGMAVGA